MQIEEYIVDIIRSQVNMPQQNIWIQSQNRKIPPQSQELYCVVGVTNFKPISSKSRWDGETLTEKQIIYGRADVQIDLMSRSNEARIRRGEILMALNSYYSKNVQDKNCFRIFELPTVFINTSRLEGGSDINRFTLIIPTMVSEVKEVAFDYYDKFQGEIWTENKIISLDLDQQPPEPPEPPVEATFTINPTPTDSVVTINGEIRTSITLPLDSEVSWSVSAEGYITQSGIHTLTGDYTLDVTLEADEPPYFIQSANYADDGVTVTYEVSDNNMFLNKNISGSYTNGFENFPYWGTNSYYLAAKPVGRPRTYLTFSKKFIKSIDFRGFYSGSHSANIMITCYLEDSQVANIQQLIPKSSTIYTLDVNSDVDKIRITLYNNNSSSTQPLYLNGIKINGK